MKRVCDLSKQTYTNFKLSIYQGMGFQQAEPFTAVVALSPLHHQRLKSGRQNLGWLQHSLSRATVTPLFCCTKTQNSPSLGFFTPYHILKSPTLPPLLAFLSYMPKMPGGFKHKHHIQKVPTHRH